MKKYIICALALYLIAIAGERNPANAQDGLGGVPGSYLFMGVGARALGMGGAYSAVANDATAIYWNPAGLATTDPMQVSFMHAILFVDTSLDFLAASVPTKRFGSFGAAILTLGSGDFEQRTTLNEAVGNFGTRDLALLISWAKELKRGFSVGLNYKLVNQSILDYSGSGHGVDLGLKARLFDRYNAALVVRNLISPKVALAEYSQKLPMQVGVGLSTSLIDEQLLVSVEYSKVDGWGDPQLHFGAEFRFVNQAAFRVGLNNGSVTIGAGFSFDSFGMGYSNIGNTELGSSHRFSLNYAFGGFGLGAGAFPRVFSPAGERNITRISLRVKSRADIQTWSFVIMDSKGRIVRQFKNDDNPPAEIVWDGRDDKGSLVEDGRFRYAFNATTTDDRAMAASGHLVTIDSRGPAGTIAAVADE